jgi:dethiobiotin synthetase
MKPFCSGGLGDVRLLQSLQPGALADQEMNPFYFARPVAPLAASSGRAPKIHLTTVVNRVRAVKEKCEVLLVEGSGGLLVPLGRGFTILDLISGLNCRTLVVASNRLGTINHTLLTLQALEHAEQQTIGVVLMGVAKPELSAVSNADLLRKMIRPTPLTEIPYLGRSVSGPKGVEKVVGGGGDFLDKVVKLLGARGE